MVDEAGAPSGFCAAYTAGSTNWLLDDASLAATSDLDVMVVLDDEREIRHAFASSFIGAHSSRPHIFGAISFIHPQQNAFPFASDIGDSARDRNRGELGNDRAHISSGGDVLGGGQLWGIPSTMAISVPCWSIRPNNK
jgi:hypothetical protein